jgi:hypothetical protein
MDANKEMMQSHNSNEIITGIVLRIQVNYFLTSLRIDEEMHNSLIIIHI